MTQNNEKNTADRDMQIWQKGFGSGQEHINPSPETRERLKALEVNQNNYMQQNTNEHKELKALIYEIKQDIKEALATKADKKDVDAMWAIFKWVALAIGTGIVGFITWFISAGVKIMT